ncbi:O-methyltransferase [Flavobacterium croceum]|uniref:O-methyltransferase n=1 Tax=Flavobacterium croceum TaxID=370975 RepID=UPI0024A9E22F|nr:class I SAM-dependent methyltransferase [Flavobacterium croceum]
MLQNIKSYIHFLWNSKNHHGVHSPFVFNLVTKCFYDKKKYEEYTVLNKYRKSFLLNKDSLKVTDFGAGSKVFKNDVRKICAIAKNAGISRKRAQLLFRLTRYFKPERILEIGSSLGLATSAMALGNPNAKITTLEGCFQTSHLCEIQLQKFHINNVECIHTKFEDYLNSFESQISTFNFIYFDGNHTKKATLDYFNLLLPTITNDTVWIFDDIHWNNDMQKAWQIIKDNPKVKVTIDTFQWGIVFFRKEQVKEHFTIRV